MADYEAKELGWDDEVEKGEGGGDFVLLPPGDYDFTVESFERARHPGGERSPECNKAVLKLRIDSPEGTTLITEGLLLYDKMEWKIAQFFLCIGEKEVNGKVKMNWPAVPGARGKATIEVTTDRNDASKKFNHVKRYLPNEPKKFEAGKF
ncbi:hypothetical protein [Lacrimispora sp.]|uniref:hypothetical protein n=1 Tax=Lacrimispora sp. TaxID=2719234 RepID=UPI0028ACF32F|nr:hypothetical protein [Lacrimispora sp.]